MKSMGERAYMQVYTGNGKGKTTAALGVAIRAAGQGLKTLIIQFMKSGFPYNERYSLERYSDLITMESFGSDEHVIEKRSPHPEEVKAAYAGIERAYVAFKTGDYSIIILDEICVAVHFGLIENADVLKIIKSRPEDIELILTGRYCPAEWIELADLVTEMKEIKHYYAKGVLSRKGIDC